MNKFTISKKVLTVLFFCIFLIQTIISVANYSHTRGNEMEIINQEAITHSEELANALIYPMWNLNEEEIKNTITFKMQSSNIFTIFLYNHDGELINQFIKDENNNLLEYSAPDLTQTEPVNSFQKITKEIIHSDENIGKLEIFITDIALQNKLNKLIIEKILETGALTLVSIIIIFFSIKIFVLNRIIELTKFVANYSPKNKQQTIEIKTSDEIGLLADSFNKMIGSLKFFDKELMKTNQMLEAKVRERTKDLTSKNEELKSFNSLVVDRELTMINLKNEIESLQKENATLKKNSSINNK